MSRGAKVPLPVPPAGAGGEDAQSWGAGIPTGRCGTSSEELRVDPVGCPEPVITLVVRLRPRLEMRGVDALTVMAPVSDDIPAGSNELIQNAVNKPIHLYLPVGETDLAGSSCAGDHASGLVCFRFGKKGGNPGTGLLQFVFNHVPEPSFTFILENKNCIAPLCCWVEFDVASLCQMCSQRLLLAVRTYEPSILSRVSIIDPDPSGEGAAAPLSGDGTPTTIHHQVFGLRSLTSETLTDELYNRLLSDRMDVTLLKLLSEKCLPHIFRCYVNTRHQGSRVFRDVQLLGVDARGQQA